MIIYRNHYTNKTSLTHNLDGLRDGNNPKDDPIANGPALITNLRQLLMLCHEHNDGKTFSAEQYAFLHGYLAALNTIKGKITRKTHILFQALEILR